MRRAILLLSILCATTVHADRVTPIDDVVNFVNLRDANGTIIGRLGPGEYADLLETDGENHRVRLADGTEGVVSRRWTSVAPDEPTAPAATDTLAIHFIDVGQGDSTLVVCPDASTILVDAGSLSGMPPEPVRDYITEVVGPDVDRIDHLIVTHADQDHYNLLPEVMHSFFIGHVYYVGYESHYYDFFWNWLQGFPPNRRTRMVQTYFNDVGTPHPFIDCGDAEVFVLAADIRSNQSWKNARSIVLMIRFGAFEAILTGDATTATENVIIGRYPANFLDVDLLKIGHHGSLATSTSPAWANTLRPRIAVASAGSQSPYGHPRQEVIERLEPHTLNDGSQAHAFSSATREDGDYVWHPVSDYAELIYGTATSGNVIVTSDGGNTFTVTVALHGNF